MQMHSTFIQLARSSRLVPEHEATPANGNGVVPRRFAAPVVGRLAAQLVTCLAVAATHIRREVAVYAEISRNSSGQKLYTGTHVHSTPYLAHLMCFVWHQEEHPASKIKLLQHSN